MFTSFPHPKPPWLMSLVLCALLQLYYCAPACLQNVSLQGQEHSAMAYVTI